MYDTSKTMWIQQKYNYDVASLPRVKQLTFNIKQNSTFKIHNVTSQTYDDETITHKVTQYKLMNTKYTQLCLNIF